jgi:type IV secretion system protein VirB4
MSDTGFLHSQLPWCFITRFHEGVVVQKDGILQRTFAFRAPDTDSASPFEVNALCLRVNDFARRLGSGWAFHIEAQRFCSTDYAPSSFEYRTGSFDALAPYLIDREREEAFRAAGSHFESSYFITFSWRPPPESVKKLTGFFIRSAPAGAEKNIAENTAFFVNETNAVTGVLGNAMLIEPLSNEETAAYLHSAVSLNRHPIRFPVTSVFLDRILPDSELITGLTMRLGPCYIPIIGVNDFPEATYPAILDSLNRARLEYRWVSRYICMDKEDGKKEAQKKEKAHRGNRKSFLQTFAETTSGEPAQALNHGAAVKEGDSIQAGIEIETDQAALGFFTSCVMVWDRDFKTAKDKADAVKTIINAAGFTCKEETFNALEAWKSMMPGQVYANFRSLPVMTNTLSHVIPLSSVWAGVRVNRHAGAITGCSLPHLVCSTAEGTPFCLNINVGDVGHTAVWGPTGAGKSTLLNLLELQFFKYPGSQVIVFDKGRSSRAPCLAVNGLFYEPASDGSPSTAFQPLRDLESEQDLVNAMDFIESLFTLNDYKVTAPLRTAIKNALDEMSGIPVHRRTLTSFVGYANYTDPDTKRPVIKDLLADYVIGGKFGHIFDASASAFSTDTRFLAFEMEALMNRGEGAVVPALVYLFSLVEKKFDGRLSMLVLDEAWLFLKHPAFAEKIAEWLKVLRKKNVFVIFATQDVADVASSPLRTTVIQQCLTKIYLADPSAATAAMRSVYADFGLTESEISAIASAVMKRDYFYTSPLGRRLFRLDLGPLTLALIGAPDHALLDSILAEPGGASLCSRILDAKRVPFRRFMGPLAPPEDPPPALQAPQAPPTAEAALQPAADQPRRLDPAALLDAAAAVPGRKKKDGSGRAASRIAQAFGVSAATVYQARSVAKHGSPGLIALVRKGEISVYKAAQRLKLEKAG